MTAALPMGCALSVGVSPMIYETVGGWQHPIAMVSVIGWIGMVQAILITGRPTPMGASVANVSRERVMAGRMIGSSFRPGGFRGVYGLYLGGLPVGRSARFTIALTHVSVAAAVGLIIGLLAGHRESIAA